MEEPKNNNTTLKKWGSIPSSTFSAISSKEQGSKTYTSLKIVMETTSSLPTEVWTLYFHAHTKLGIKICWYLKGYTKITQMEGYTKITQMERNKRNCQKEDHMKNVVSKVSFF